MNEITITVPYLVIDKFNWKPLECNNSPINVTSLEHHTVPTSSESDPVNQF